MDSCNRALWIRVLVTVLLVLWSVVPAAAHGFGQRYDLPVPLWLYATGAAAAVACSFAVIGVFVRGTHGMSTYPRVNLLRSPVGRLVAHPVLLLCLKLASVGLFIVLILAGLLGQQTPTKNLAPTLVWVIWWVGLAYVSALGGNLWALINPWKVLFEWAEALYRHLAPGGNLSRHWPYPTAWGRWPGVLLFLAFAWAELVFDGSAVPANLAVMALGYSVLTWTGMFLFGTARWLENGEAFSLAFGLLARFAPTEVRVVGADVCQTCDLACRDDDGECINCYACFRRADPARREWNVRPFAVGLARNQAVSISQMVFVLLLLATVTFDGFMATPLWADIESSLYAILPDWGGSRLTVIGTVGLLVFPLLFLEVYVVCGALMATASGRRCSGERLARIFAFSLVPIAIAYHMAHYLSFLLIQGQLLIPLASDPFGYGWNLLGTAAYRVNIGLVGARFVWYTAVTAIVSGHIIAVYVAHRTAMRTLRDPTLARRSQYPMLALMVGYTVISLWILAQPIVESAARVPTTTRSAVLGVVGTPPAARSLDIYSASFLSLPLGEAGVRALDGAAGRGDKNCCAGTEELCAENDVRRHARSIVMPASLKVIRGWLPRIRVRTASPVSALAPGAHVPMQFAPAQAAHAFQQTDQPPLGVETPLAGRSQ